MLCGKQPGCPTTETKFKGKHRMEFGCVKAKYSLENPGNLAENLLKIPGKIFHCAVGHPARGCFEGGDI